MEIHLLRSNEVSFELVQSIYNRIGTHKGPVKYYWDEEHKYNEDEKQSAHFEENIPLLNKEEYTDSAGRAIFPWAILFECCESYREKKKIGKEDVVVLLTGYENKDFWFSAWESSEKRNFFIKTSEWEDLIKADPCYPIIYELVTIPITLAAFDTLEGEKKWAHYKPRGCVFDYCKHKREVQLRLRTADICQDCSELLIERKTDPATIKQVFETLESIRSQMLFRERFRLTKSISPLEIDIRKRKIRFKDIGNLELKPGPRELAVYIFFMNHPEGVIFKQIDAHREEISFLYRQISKTDIESKIINTIEAMADHTNNTMQELVSKINEAIKDTIGAEAAKDYIIQGKKGEKFNIQLDRKLLIVKGL